MYKSEIIHIGKNALNTANVNVNNELYPRFRTVSVFSIWKYCITTAHNIACERSRWSMSYILYIHPLLRRPSIAEVSAASANLTLPHQVAILNTPAKKVIHQLYYRELFLCTIEGLLFLNGLYNRPARNASNIYLIERIINFVKKWLILFCIINNAYNEKHLQSTGKPPERKWKTRNIASWTSYIILLMIRLGTKNCSDLDRCIMYTVAPF